MIREEFFCKRDDLTIRGFLNRPDDDSVKYPAVILSHGFMGSHKDMEAYAGMFAGMGYVAVAFDFNGGGTCSQSDGRTTDMSVLTEKEDLKAVIRAAASLPFVDEQDIMLIGFSQGGFVSALTARELQEKIRRLILVYPAFCIPDDAGRGRMILARFDPENIPDTIECGPMLLGKKYVTDVLGMDPFKETRDYRGPVLIIHGTEDDLVLPSYSHRAYKSYLETHGNAPSKNCQLVLIDGGNHGFYGPDAKAWDKYVRFAIQKFLEGRTLYFNVDVRLTEREEEPLANGGRRIRLYFEGHSSSGFFEGDVQTPAYDEQICYGETPDTCCASYTLEGTDYCNHKCRVHITNRMLPGRDRDWQLDWKPQIQTDSELLSVVNTLKCETYAEERSMGPHIHIWG